MRRGAQRCKVPRNVQLADFDFFQPAMLDFPGYAHAGDDGHTHTHLHETFDAFDRGHLDRHVQRRAMAGEQLDDFAAEGRFDDVGDEGFFSQLFDVDFFAFCQACFGGTTSVNSSFRISVACSCDSRGRNETAPRSSR